MRTWIAVVYAATLIAQERPNMSGVWQLNKENSKVACEMAWAKVGLAGSTFSIYLRTVQGGTEESFDWKFSLGSGESSNTMHGAPMKSHAAWESDALVVRSVTMFGDGALNTVDRYTLSPDRNTLTSAGTHQFGNEPQGTSVFVFDRRPLSAWPPAENGKLAEEVYKNILVLKGVSAQRIPAIMGSFSQGLGVACGHCHVAGDFANDSKPAKQTARDMWRMVTDIDKSIGASERVTCWTCHRGSVKPESRQP